MASDPYDIEEALATFLLTPQALADAQRSYSLRALQALVGRQVYNARRPQTASGPLAVTIQEAGSDPAYGLLNEDPLAMTYLRIVVWGQRGYPPRDVRLAKGHLHIVLTGYKSSTATWDGIAIDGCTLVGGWNTVTNVPVDATDNWLFSITSLWLVSHCQILAGNGSVATA